MEYGGACRTLHAKSRVLCHCTVIKGQALTAHEGHGILHKAGKDETEHFYAELKFVGLAYQGLGFDGAISTVLSGCMKALGLWALKVREASGPPPVSLASSPSWLRQETVAKARGQAPCHDLLR